jgi:NTP pyrophosphatase (non-canonical NTP hydrolase)
MATLRKLIDQILVFRDEREWGKFHTPRQHASALAIECGELQETMLWKTDEEVAEMISQPETRQNLEEEIADVLIQKGDPPALPRWQ